MIAPHEVLHVFHQVVGVPLAPGSVIQIHGSNLATSVVTASGTPLPTTLGGTSVLIGGLLAPLFYATPNDVKAQVPFELVAGKEYEVQVAFNGALSAAESIALVAASPGIAATESGAASARHLDSTLVSNSSPARPGESVILYLAGMGAPDEPLATGAEPPADSLLRVSEAPTVSINGHSLETEFAGLAPGAVGLYQLRIRIPSELADGLAKIVVVQSGIVSNTVALPVQR
jgi:uncharacterized protein (TIGR03437 family)